MNDREPTDVVRAHVTAFNARDLDGLTNGFVDDAVWRTGRDTVHGRADLEQLFSAAMEQLVPTLVVRSILSEGTLVAAQIVETLVCDGAERVHLIAGFYEIESGRIRTATIYREGSADVA